MFQKVWPEKKLNIKQDNILLCFLGLTEENTLDPLLLGIALATSGPDVANLLTGIGSCYFDSTPAFFITGQVNSFLPYLPMLFMMIPIFLNHFVASCAT